MVRVNIDDYFDAQYEAAIETSAYHKAKYGYLDGEYKESTVLRDDRRMFNATTVDAREKSIELRYGKQAYFDPEVIRAAFGGSPEKVSLAAGFKRGYLREVLSTGRTSLERLKALCAVLELDVNEVLL